MIPVTLFLFFVYLALTATFSWPNLVLGLVLALGAARLLAPRGRGVAWHRLPGAVAATLRYLLLLLWELLVGGVQTARIVLSPSLPVRPAIIAIPTDCNSELSLALSAHAITLSPGELVLEIGDDGVFYTHVLDVSRAAEQVADAQAQRQSLLSQIFS